MKNERNRAWMEFVKGLVLGLMDTKERKVKTKDQLANECNQRFYFMRRSGRYTFPLEWENKNISVGMVKRAIEEINAEKLAFIQVNRSPRGYVLIWGKKNGQADIIRCYENVEYQKQVVAKTIDSQILQPVALAVMYAIPDAYSAGLIQTKEEAEKIKEKLLEMKPIEATLEAVNNCKNVVYKPVLLPLKITG